ncbi:MAG: recombinase family protein [Streptosporangiaceae bacterium]
MSEDEWVEDPRTGEMRLSEKGITRQQEDILALAAKLGVDIVKWYPENDTTAFKKRRIRLPNGRSVWRVIRPEFRQMLEDYEDGVIDGVIFYDIDRLARQPRDLEDLIDLAEYYRRPVETVTGNIDLRTSNGRAMARVLVAMANKSSEDTSRRVARARLQQAQEGRSSRTKGSRRRFGYRADGTVIEAEADLIENAARRFLAGDSWRGLTILFEDSGIRPVSARNWSLTSVKQILLAPTVAGIAMYNGVLREGSPAGRRSDPYTDPEGVALKDASGEYVRGNWPPILTIEEWKAVISEQQHRKDGRTPFSAHGTRKHLLSGLLRCGRIREDGSMCNRSLTGAVRRYPNGKVDVTYRCPPRAEGGCGGIQRSAARLDALIEDLLFAHIAANAPRYVEATDLGEDDTAEAKQLTEVRRRLREMRTGYARGTVSDESMFSTVPSSKPRNASSKARQLRKHGRASVASRGGRNHQRMCAASGTRQWIASPCAGRSFPDTYERSLSASPRFTAPASTTPRSSRYGKTTPSLRLTNP